MPARRSGGAPAASARNRSVQTKCISCDVSAESSQIAKILVHHFLISEITYNILYLTCFAFVCSDLSAQPWCDGSHEGTKFEPVEFTAPEAKLYSMCLCKYSQKGALCDGIHKQYIGWEPPVRPAGGAASGSNGSGPEAAAAAAAAAADSK